MCDKTESIYKTSYSNGAVSPSVLPKEWNGLRLLPRLGKNNVAGITIVLTSPLPENMPEIPRTQHKLKNIDMGYGDFGFPEGFRYRAYSSLQEEFGDDWHFYPTIEWEPNREKPFAPVSKLLVTVYSSKLWSMSKEEFVEFIEPQYLAMREWVSKSDRFI